MTKSDLITKESVLRIIQEQFIKYGIGFKPEGDDELDGISAELPQLIELLSPEYDVDKVIESIRDGQSLNIPHQGYCMNKDIAIQHVRDGLNLMQETHDIPFDLTSDINKAIQFISLRSFCDECIGMNKNCMECNRYNSKKTALIALNFYSKFQEMLSQLNDLKTKSEFQEDEDCYDQAIDLLQQAYDYAHDRRNLF